MSIADTAEGLAAKPQGHNTFPAQVSDETFAFREVRFDDRKVTGAQIAQAAGAHPVEDYVVLAEAKGLKAPTVFLRYCMRNAVLPQVTALALALGQILSGAVLVEVIFGYPGIGTLLYQAIRESDHFVIQGIVFTVIVALGLTTFVLDVVYPWLDPRISYRRS